MEAAQQRLGGKKNEGVGVGRGGEKATSLSLFLSSSFSLSKLYKLRITVGCFSTSVFGYGTSSGSCFRNTTPSVLEVTLENTGEAPLRKFLLTL